MKLRTRHRAQGMRGALSLLLDVTADGTLRQTNVYGRARWRMYLGDSVGALEELELAYQTQQFNLMYVAADPMFERLRPDPAFQQILSRMRLPRTDQISSTPPGASPARRAATRP